jgi:hypothetical protein
MTQTELYIEQLEAENEALREKNESLLKLADDIVNNKAIRAEEIINLDVAFCSWIVPRLKMYLHKMHPDDKQDKKLVKDIKAMIDGFSTVTQLPSKEKPQVYPSLGADDAKMFLKAQKVFEKRLGRLWM